MVNLLKVEEPSLCLVLQGMVLMIIKQESLAQLARTLVSYLQLTSQHHLIYNLTMISSVTKECLYMVVEIVIRIPLI